MGGQVAIVGTKVVQPLANHAEVLGLLEGNLHPAIEKRIRHGFRRKTRDDIEREIDGIEFDMGDRMQKRDPPLERAQRSLLHLGWWCQKRLFRSTRPERNRPVER
ncbi:hypothetical protein D9M72_595530 [compost metagenome]